MCSTPCEREQGEKKKNQKKHNKVEFFYRAKQYIKSLLLILLWQWHSYRSHSAEEASVAEEDDEQGDTEVEDKHIDDERGVVDLRLGSVVVNPTGTLHSLWDIPAQHTITQRLRPAPLHSICATCVSYTSLQVLKT